MTRDEIISMARKAGFEQQMRHFRPGTGILPDALFIRFAALVAAHEREELLDLVDSYAKDNADLKDAIRARAEKETFGAYSSKKETT